MSNYFFENTIYWSEGDEKAHFQWMAQIGCIREVKGIGSRVYLEIDEVGVSDLDACELAAIYRRYGGDLTQLASLAEGRSGLFLDVPRT